MAQSDGTSQGGSASHVDIIGNMTILRTLCVCGLAAQTVNAGIVNFYSDDFWLNLHHFLYVLGQSEAKMPNWQRAAVADAPIDQDKSLSGLTPEEQKIWREAVAAYVAGPSRRDAISDRVLVTLTGTLATLGDSPALASATPVVPPDTAATLERAAPIYRKAWWPAHHRANQQWTAEMRALVDRHGERVVAFITTLYQLPWPHGGYPVHVSAYTNWAGAYSTSGPLLVVSSLVQGNHGDSGLELVFHESMHQWDQPIGAKLEELARATGKKVPDGLTHAMIWFTAGEAVRQVIPSHVPIAEAGGIWKRQPNATLRPAIEAAWAPFVKGKGTRDEALAELVKLAGR